MTLPKNSKQWEPCYADPTRGVAFFDSLLIEADPITDSRWDRVLPLLEEEQIFMCRQMLPVLKKMPGASVLDVGTGSGVFAIWAAKHGLRVVAIDVNPRALRIAKQNASANHIACSEDQQRLNRLADGEICFILGDVFKRKFDNACFDLVFLSPPYNPTWPGIEPPLHAEAGEDGQRCFEDQITLVPKILKEGGICIGNQMTPVNATGIRALKTIEKAFEARCKIRYTKIIQRDEYVRTFLEGQYSDYLSLEDVPNYIDRLSDKFSGFALIYYEVKKGRDLNRNPRCFKNIYQPHQNSPEIWKRRASLHRNIIDHITSKTYLSLPSLFVSNFPTFAAHGSSLNDGTDEERKFANSPLKRIDDFLLQREAVSEKPLFDIVFIDSAPIYKLTQDIIDEECKLWALSNDDRIERSAKKLIEKWQANTGRLQMAKIGPFLHPLFSGLFSKKKWSKINYSILPNDIPSETEDRLRDENHFSLLKSYREWFEKNSGQAEERLRANISEKLCFSWTTLGALSVPDPVDYYASLNLSERLPMRYDRKYNTIRDKYRNGEIFEALKTNNLPSHERELLIDLLQNDLSFCHLIMHEQIDKEFKPILEESNYDYKWSALIGLPLSFENESVDRVYSELPDSYRGGVWIFVATKDEFSLHHERYLFDIARFAWLTFMYRFSIIHSKIEQTVGGRQGLVDARNIFSHEIKHIANAISLKWLFKPDSDLRKSIDRHIDNRSPKKDARWKSPDWMLVPIPELFEAAGNMIRLWTLTNDPADVFNKVPDNKLDFISACWELAKNSIKPFYAKGKLLTDTADLYENLMMIRQVLERIDERFDRKFDPTLLDRDAPEPYWNKYSPWMNLARLLTATFVNCIRHGDNKKEVTVKVTKEGDFMMFEVMNHKKPIRPDDFNTLDPLEEIIESASEQITSSPSKFHGEDVIKNLYNKLNPSIMDEAIGPTITPDKYTYLFKLPIKDFLKRDRP